MADTWSMSSLFACWCSKQGLPRSGLRPLVHLGLQRLPLAHEVADLPHELLVLLRRLLGPGPVVVEAGGGYWRLGGLHRLLLLRDPLLEIEEARLQALQVALPGLAVRGGVRLAQARGEGIVAPARRFAVPARIVRGLRGGGGRARGHRLRRRLRR